MKTRASCTGNRVQFKLWVDKQIKSAIEAKALENGRTANAEAVERLIRSIMGKPRYRIPMARG